MSSVPARVAAIIGSRGATTQALLTATVADWRASGVRVVGLLGGLQGLPDRSCGAGYLRDITSRTPFSIYSEALPSSTTCHLDAAGVAGACAAILDQIPTGDLVVLNKFGKLEAAHEGLAAAFDAAITAGRPLLTTVSDAHLPAWREFVHGATELPADRGALQNWWRTVQAIGGEQVGSERIGTEQTA